MGYKKILRSNRRRARRARYENYEVRLHIETKERLEKKYPHINFEGWSIYDSIPDPMERECPVCLVPPKMMCERRGTILRQVHRERGEAPKRTPYIWSWRSAHKRWRKSRTLSKLKTLNGNLPYRNRKEHDTANRKERQIVRDELEREI